jgi:hypothetical protein
MEWLQVDGRRLHGRLAGDIGHASPPHESADADATIFSRGRIKVGSRRLESTVVVKAQSRGFEMSAAHG